MTEAGPWRDLARSARSVSSIARAKHLQLSFKACSRSQKTCYQSISHLFRSFIGPQVEGRFCLSTAGPWRDLPAMYACAGKGRPSGEKSPECALRHANLARFHRNARKWRKITVVARIPVIFRHSRGRFPRKCAFREFFARQRPLAVGSRPARCRSLGNAATWVGASP